MAKTRSKEQRALMQGLYQRKMTWWLRFTPVTGGKQVRVSLETRDLEEAIQLAKEKRGQVTIREREKAESCEGEIQRWLQVKRAEGLSVATLDYRKHILRAFVRELEAASPLHISAGGVERWWSRHRERNIHTAIDYLDVVRWWLEWLVKLGKLRRNHALDIQVPKVKPRERTNFLRAPEARALIEACGDDRDLKFAVFCGLHAGLRKNEVIEARPEWFDLEAGLLHVQVTETFVPKDRDHRTIPLTDEFRAWLGEVGLQGPFMFRPNVKHGKYQRYRCEFVKAFASARKRAGVECTFHDLRRTFASLLVSSGVSLYKVAKWLGDEMETVQKHYGHLIPQDDEVNKAWR
jgi:integrase